MKIKIKRFDKHLSLPEYKTKGAAGFDLVARETIVIQPHSVGYVPLNIAVETPPDHFFMLAARSSTHKKGLMAVNGVGIGDSDFCGDDDEYKIALLNFTDQPATVDRGERIAQGLFVPVSHVEWDEVDAMNNATRGGFGSTGSN